MLRIAIEDAIVDVVDGIQVLKYVKLNSPLLWIQSPQLPVENSLLAQLYIDPKAARRMLGYSCKSCASSIIDIFQMPLAFTTNEVLHHSRGLLTQCSHAARQVSVRALTDEKRR